MRRRDVLLLGTVAIAWPTAARPQTSGGIVPVIGFLGSGSAAAWQPALFGASGPIRQGLSETGFTEGKNVVIEYRWADDHYDRLSALAVELAQKDIAALVAPGTVAAAKAAMVATRTIPIVFMIASDPVEDGLVSSFNHPGGNVTGEGYLNAQLAPKRLQLLHEVVPAAAAACSSLVCDSASTGLAGLTSSVIVAAAGTASCSSWSRFDATCALR